MTWTKCNNQNHSFSLPYTPKGSYEWEQSMIYNNFGAHCKTLRSSVLIPMTLAHQSLTLLARTPEKPWTPKRDSQSQALLLRTLRAINHKHVGLRHKFFHIWPLNMLVSIVNFQMFDSPFSRPRKRYKHGIYKYNQKLCFKEPVQKSPNESKTQTTGRA